MQDPVYSHDPNVVRRANNPHYADVYSTARVVDKAQRNRLCCHFLIVLLTSIAMAIATGIFLFNIEESN